MTSAMSLKSAVLVGPKVGGGEGVEVTRKAVHDIGMLMLLAEFSWSGCVAASRTAVR